MYKTAEHTLFIGKNIVFVNACASTNDLALQLSHHSTTSEGTVVITDLQTAGRGQRGNNWEAQPKQNLTFSIILKPTFLPVTDQFFLTVFTSLAIHDYLKSKTTEAIKIKWPNDILITDKKICGVLIENQVVGKLLSSSVIGVGLNVLQQEFSISTATSLACVTNEHYNLSTEFSNLLSFLEVRYMQLRQNKFNELRNDYLANLYRIDEKHLYKSKDVVFEGTIIGIDGIGRLRLNTNGGERVFGLKEIVYL